MTASPRDTYLGLRAFADELVRCGVRHACTSPGSRSTPLVLTLAREPRLRSTSHIDERCAAFFALGVAKASGMPAALACTSGTAAANYAPAVIEAYEARVPLLVLTADRPPELRDVGAGQTIDQVKLYGRAAKWYLEVDAAPATPERIRWLRQLACRAVWTALDGRPGPVHLNFAFREPLVLGDEALPEDDSGRPGGRPWVERAAPAPPPAPEVSSALAEHPRAIVVAGRDDRGDGRAVAEFARRARLPLLAEPLSGARRGEAIAHYDAFLRDPETARRLAPELVIRTGDLPTSKPLRLWLAGLGPDVPQLLLDPEWAWQDPAAAVATIVHGRLPDPDRAFAPEDWIASWRAADEGAREAIGEVLGSAELTEPGVAAALSVDLPPEATLVVASSMPVRDVETFFATRAEPPRVLANRGANGIDGTVSTAYGVAASSDGPVVLLIGDVALAHDIGGLLAARRTGTELTIVVLNNDGGGIFDFLPVAAERDHFTEHVATPHGLDFAHAASLYGLDHVSPATLPELRDAVRAGGSALIEVRTDRAANVGLHRRVWAAVADSVRRAP